MSQFSHINNSTSTWEFYASGAERECRITPIDAFPNISVEEASFFLYDHLGNTRITYTPLEVNGIIGMRINSVVDYFPYGKVLGEFYEASDKERYLTTQHERDEYTGLDYRGVRYYDSDVARFLSLDPLARDYPHLIDYCYVARKPIIFIDPDGKEIIIHYIDEDGVDQTLHINNMEDIDALQTHSNEFVRNMFETLNYLRGEKEVAFAIKTKKTVDVYSTTGTVEHSIDENGNSRIDYDPYEALETVEDSEVHKSVNDRVGTGKIQTPALGFLHELGHFTGKVKLGSSKQEAYRRKKHDLYHNLEEKRVIIKVENKAAKRLEEPARTNHGGIPRTSKGTTSIEVEKRKPVKTINGL